MKYILIALALLSVSGCGDTTSVYPYQIDEAELRCSVNGGLKAVRSSSIYKTTITDAHTEIDVYCTNGAKFRLRMTHPKTL